MLLIILALLFIGATARFIRTNNLIGIELPEGDTKLIKYINMMNNTVHFLNTEEEKALGIDWASYMYTPERLRDEYGLAPLPEKLYIAKKHIAGDGVVEETREEYIDRAYSLLDKHFEGRTLESECFYQENIREYASRKKNREILKSDTEKTNRNMYKDTDWDSLSEEEIRKIYVDCIDRNKALIYDIISVRDYGINTSLDEEYDYKPVYETYIKYIKEINKNNKIYNGLRVRHMVGNNIICDINKLKLITNYKEKYTDRFDDIHINCVDGIKYGAEIRLFGEYYLPISIDGRLAGLLLLSDVEGHIPDILTEDILTAIRILNKETTITEYNAISGKTIDDINYLVCGNIRVKLPSAQQRLTQLIKEGDTPYISPEISVKNDIEVLSTNNTRETIDGYDVLNSLKQLDWDYVYPMRGYLNYKYPEATIFYGKQILENYKRMVLEEEWLYDIDGYAYTYLTDAFSKIDTPSEVLELKRNFTSSDWFIYDHTDYK